MDRPKKKLKNQSIVIVNSKARTTRPITIEVLAQEQKLKLKRRGKEHSINPDLAQEKNPDINSRDICSVCNRSLKTEKECGICSRWFHYK